VRRTVEEARAIILDAAEQIVLEVGPAGLRIQDVARRAGMAHPNVLHHFGSREGLLRELTVRTTERVTTRVVRSMEAAMLATPGDRVETLARVLDAVYEGDQGRLLAWLIISGRIEGLEHPDLEPLVRITHAWRTAAIGPADEHDTRRLILLASLALLGDAIVGADLIESLGLGRGEQGRTEFHTWLAGFILAQIERE
jgi:AcrR family transcriptional regulator